MVESATAAMKSAIEDEQANQQDADEWKRQLDLLGAEFGRVRASFVQAVGKRDAASRIIAYAQYRVETGQVQASEATEKKQAFLRARDENNNNLIYRDLFHSSVTPSVLRKELGVEGPGAMADLNRFHLLDFRMILANGGLEQNPAMGGRIINGARERNRLGLNESIQDEMEKANSYLEMREDDTKQPPVADLLRSPAGTPGIDTRKRASRYGISLQLNLFRSTQARTSV